MKTLRWVVLLAAVLGLSAVTKADGIDPKVGLGGGGSCASFDQTSATQSFTITNLGCVIDFNNDVGAALTSLTVTINSSFAGALSCAIDSFQGSDGEFSGTFSNPPFNSAATNGNSCTFSGAGPLPDAEGSAPGVVTPGGIYSLQFGYPGLEFLDANGNQLTSLDVTISAPVPEPGTLILLGTGLAALAVRRRRKNKTGNS